MDKAQLRMQYEAKMAALADERALAIMQYEVSSELMRIQIAEAETNLAMLRETEAAMRTLINTMAVQPLVQ